MEDPNSRPRKSPTLLAGRANRKLTTGLHVRDDRETPICNLYCSMMDMLGVRVEKFGDSTGKLEICAKEGVGVIELANFLRVES